MEIGQKYVHGYFLSW